jgi:signal transduction histidine kinase
LSLNLQLLEREVGQKSGLVPAQKLRSHLQSMRRQVLNLAGLVNMLLDVSRIRAGRMDFSFETLDFSEVAREVAAQFEPQALQAGSTLEVHSDGQVMGRSDRQRLEQVLTNLLSNAIKFGAGRPIRLSVEPHGDRVVLRVQDRGIGIPPEALGRIFNRFERGVSGRHYGGLGLGLYVTRQIVEAMEGVVGVRSAPERGATFTVELPRSQRLHRGSEEPPHPDASGEPTAPTIA